MKDNNAQSLLAEVMGWKDTEVVQERVPTLQLLADYKYDQYQRFGPGKRFIESLALWLKQFDVGDREAALKFVEERMVFISDRELSHLVQLAYPDVISQEVIRLVAEEKGIPIYRVGEITRHPRFKQLQRKSLYLGLSDGARTNELRRGSNQDISNEQIWQAYELGDAKAKDMLTELRSVLSDESKTPVVISNDSIWAEYESGGREKANELLEAMKAGLSDRSENVSNEKFNLIWLLDDFSGSGNTYIRFDSKTGRFKGKIKKIYERLHRGDLIDPAHYEVFLLLYTATRQAIDHIEYWAERFTSEMGYKPLQVRVLSIIEPNVAVDAQRDSLIVSIAQIEKYYDERASDKHILVGGTRDARMGFAGCALPVVLPHNTPNNSLYLLWGPETFRFFGLFPRASRHREF